MLDLIQALDRRKNYLEQTTIPKLKEKFQSLKSSYQAIYNLLIKKKLVNEDPYKFDKQISEITIPSKEPFGESEKTEQMGIRLSDFELQLDFIINYYDFSLNTLTMQDIKRIAALLKYIQWDNLSETSPKLMTRSLASLLVKIKQGADQLSAKILGDAVNQIGKMAKQVIAILKEISSFHREQYKLELRERLLPELKLTPALVQHRIDDALKHVKQRYAATMGGVPFYQVLVIEVLQEEYSDDADIMKRNLIKTINVEEEKPKQKKSEVSYKLFLLDGVRIAASASPHLEVAVKKLEHNNELLHNKKLSFGEKLKAWIQSISKKKSIIQIYEIEYFDGVSTSAKSEKIDFTSFIEGARKRAQILANLVSKLSPQYMKLEQAHEDKIFVFLSNNISELQLYLRRLTGLDSFFKTEVPKDQKAMIKGIKLELNSIKNASIKANQKKHEYVSSKEERDQLRKLGIEVD